MRSWVELLMVMMMIVVVGSSAADTLHPDPIAVHEHDVCEDGGAGLQCPSPRHALHVLGARCAGPGGGGARGELRSCSPDVVETLLRTCEARASCADKGLGQVFGTLCHPNKSSSAAAAAAGADRGVLVVGYQCQKFGDRTHQHDVCEDGGAWLQCPPGKSLLVLSARCRHPRGGRGLAACSPHVKETLLRLCNGRQSCAGLGLGQVFGTLCQPRAGSSSAGWTAGGGGGGDSRGVVIVGYQCRGYYPNEVPSCGVNLCSPLAQGLLCPAGSALHVRGMGCGTAGYGPPSSCSLPAVLATYALCEGRPGCDASGLRMVKSIASSYCRRTHRDGSTPPPLPPADRSGGRSSPSHYGGGHRRNDMVLVDFFCVPDSQVHSQCQPHPVNLTGFFGLLMSPAFLGGGEGGGGGDHVSSPITPAGSPRQCQWVVDAPRHAASRELTVRVHIVTGGDCHAQHVLKVSYLDCQTLERVVRTFCDVNDVDVPIKSCSYVHVTSPRPSDSGDVPRFVLSYHTGKGEKAVPDSMRECSTPLVTPLHPSTPAPPPLHTTRPTFSHRNYGPGRTMFDYSDTIRHMGADSERSEHDEEDETFQLKLILLYIFFGVVIMALIIALIYVLMSYRGISRRGRHGSDSSEKTALWRHEDTPLHTFSHNSHVTLADVANSCDLFPHPPSPPPPPSSSSRREDNNDHDDLDDAGGSPDSQLVACTVHAKSADEEGEAEERRLSTGSAFSAGFLSGKDMDLQDLLDSFHPSDSSVARKDSGDYDIIAGCRDGGGGDYDSIGGGKDAGGDYDVIAAGRDGGGDYESLADVRTTTGVPLFRDGEDSGGAKTSAARSNSFLVNGDAGNIYESIEDQRQYRQQTPGRTDWQGDAPRSPPLVPSPLPRNDPSYVEHYTINDDDYALVRKPKSNGSAGGKMTTAPPAMFHGGSRGQPEASQTSSAARVDVDQGCVSGGRDVTGGVKIVGQPGHKDLGVKRGEHV